LGNEKKEGKRNWRKAEGRSNSLMDTDQDQDQDQDQNRSTLHAPDADDEDEKWYVVRGTKY
jgi:hypothetical protein